MKKSKRKKHMENPNLSEKNDLIYFWLKIRIISKKQNDLWVYANRIYNLFI